jgi:RNA polymerase sigma-70 factor (ECF subfamily)
LAIDVGTWYERHGPMVLRRCRALLKDEATAVDAMHDVFVEVLRRAASLEDTGACTYLWRAATHVCLNRLRAQRRAPVDADDAALLEIAALDDGEARLVASDLLARVLGDEAPSTRVMATLLYVDRLTLDEVAAAMDLSVSGVRKRLRSLQQRARGRWEALTT